ncbi:MAG TPA: arginase family protein [Terrimesophilobacter sp.]|uniref:arginase family protein n=1 Tax=Terrimesophilobacter sp. TaxID=2906435 RepID=UPI002F958EB8
MNLATTNASFLNVPTVTDTSLVETPYAFVGIPYGPPYKPADLAACEGAADAVRAITHEMAYALNWSHYDFDLGRPMFEDGVPTVTDCGNVETDVRDPDAIWAAGVAKLRPLAQAGRVPLVVGGLDSIPPIVVEAFDGLGTYNILHVDAHLDFREELHGVTRGYSSPIRRIREYGCVGEVVQVGLRSMGSARPSDVADARAAGNRIITTWELQEAGAQSVLDSLPTDNKWIITIDCDGLDPSIAPGVGWPEPGGLSYFDIATLVRGLAEKGLVAAIVFTEFQPGHDVRGTTAKTIARLFMNVMGLQR